MRMQIIEGMDSFILARKNTVRELMTKVNRLTDELKADKEISIERQEMIRKGMEKEINKLKNFYSEEIKKLNLENLKAKENDELHIKKSKEEKERMIEEWTKRLNEIENNHYQNIQTALELNNEKEVFLENQKIEFRKEINNMKKSLGEQLSKIEESYQGKCDDIRNQYNELLKKNKVDYIKFEQGLEQCENEYEKEIGHLKDDFYTNLRIYRDTNNELTNNLGKSEKTLKDTNKMLGEIKSQKDAATTKVEELKIYKGKVEGKLKEAEFQLRNQEYNLCEKNKEMERLRKDNKQLENYRNVMSNEIDALQKQKEPMENQVKELKTQIDEMKKELGFHLNANESLRSEKSSCEQRIKNLTMQTKQQLNDLTAARRKLELINYDLVILLKEPPDTWPQSLVRIYTSYFCKSTDPETLVLRNKEVFDFELPEPAGKNAEESKLLKSELVKQKLWLEGRLEDELRKKSQNKSENTTNIRKLQQENIMLIKEMNNIRISNNKMKLRVRQVEDKFSKITGIPISKVDLTKLNSDTQQVHKSTNSFKHKSIQESNTTALHISEKNNSSMNLLINDLQSNKQIIKMQNNEITKLQVNFYLRNRKK